MRAGPAPQAAPHTAPWLATARAECGVAAAPPGQSNPRITAYHAYTNIAGYEDKAAWCSSFLHWVLARWGVAGTGSALARSWAGWGVALERPRPGCVAVLWRDDPASWKGHVGLYLHDDGEQVTLLGGNQQGEVREWAYPLASVLAWRWPAGPSPVLFHTERTRVRPLVHGDQAALLQVYGDADAMRYVGDGRPLTPAQCDEWVQVTARNRATRGYGMNAIEHVLTGQVLGFCGLVHPGGQAQAEVKYAFARAHWRQGYAREVVPALLQHGFERHGLREIIATVHPAHTVSARVLQGAGLQAQADRHHDDGSTSRVFLIQRPA